MTNFLNTDHLQQCFTTLNHSFEYLQKAPLKSVEYDVFRNAVVKGFELTLETAGKLLRKALRAYIGLKANSLTYKEVLREASKYGLLTTDAVERWFVYRDNRNDTAHDYGENLAEETLTLLPEFLKDVEALEIIIKQQQNRE